MAKTTVNPEADLQARPRDVALTPEQVAVLGVFTSLKKPLSFVKYPGSWVLRHYRAGEAICQQGAAGGTAYYLVTRADVDSLASTLGSEANKTVADNDETVSISNLIENARVSLRSAAVDSPDAQLRLATARVLVDRESRGLMRPVHFLRSLWRRPTRDADRLTNPSFIPNDGPADIDYETGQASLYEGEVFGEISCMTRQPRSATVVAAADCFVLEFLRNILEQMQKDEKYKAAMEKKYRERVLEGHLRQLSVFRLVSAEDFKTVKENVELVRMAPGKVLWDEGDLADGVYVVRNGIVQVVQSYPWRVNDSHITDWPTLWKILTDNTRGPAVECLCKGLPKSVQEQLNAEGSEPSAELKADIVAAFNELAKSPSLLVAKETKDFKQDPSYLRERAAYPEKEKNWTDLQIRRANRVLIHLLFPVAIAPPEPLGKSRVLEYLGPGSVLGEIGILLKQPRSATCMAFAHADADREATDIELVRVSKELFQEIAERSEQFKKEMQKLVSARLKHDQEIAAMPLGRSSESRRVQELGLLQGQNLMLIDLDRCTRCGDCVQACIDTHEDGHSRLYLDGPRFGKYLVPSSCRRCTDPVCMIGCPVGSIQQGPAGEIRIRDWCIGCGLCAEQCPYDSIQMHDIALVPTGAPGWYWTNDAAAEGDHWSEPSFSERRWRLGATPFLWGLDFQLGSSNGISVDSDRARRILFRYRFNRRAKLSTMRRHRLLITSQSAAVNAYLNGQPLELTQDAAQKKRGLFVAVFEDKALTNTENVLAIAVAAPKEFGAVVLDARIDTLAPESVTVEEKLVTERAVVCDQCSSLSGDRHACVYACPHEAALRINAWADFPEAVN